MDFSIEPYPAQQLLDMQNSMNQIIWEEIFKTTNWDANHTNKDSGDEDDRKLKIEGANRPAKSVVPVKQAHGPIRITPWDLTRIGPDPPYPGSLYLCRIRGQNRYFLLLAHLFDVWEQNIHGLSNGGWMDHFKFKKRIARLLIRDYDHQSRYRRKRLWKQNMEISIQMQGLLRSAMPASMRNVLETSTWKEC